MLRTWLPDVSFVKSGRVLHDDEVHRVRQDVLFILNVLAGRHQHMKYSPHVVMWRGAELSLVSYGVTMCREWKARGKPDKLEAQIWGFGEEALATNVLNPVDNGNRPWWLGNDGFHLSHQSGLVTLRPDFYKKIFRGVPSDLPMVTPDPTGPGGVRVR